MSESINGARRFYKSVTIAQLETGFAVLLDGRKIITPDKKPLILPTLAAAEVIANEWLSQEETIKTASMPMTRLVNLAIDKGSESHVGMAEEIRKYLSSDLVCYRVSAPERLAIKQEMAWDSVINWLYEAKGIKLYTAKDSLALIQSDDELNKAFEYANSLNDLHLTLLTFLTGLTGSAALAMAMFEGFINADEVFKAIRIEEDHNAEIWGYDYEDLDKSQEKHNDLIATEKLIKSLNL